MVETTLAWRDGLTFTASTARGSLAVGPVEEGAADRFGPKELVAMGLAGYTGMDVASILEKMRAVPERFEVSVAGESAAEHPQRMVRFRVRYRIDGPVTTEQALRAVRLSLTRYCGVAATLAAAARIEPEIVLNGETLALDAVDGRDAASGGA